MIPLEDALAIVLAHAPVGPTTRSTLLAAQGRVLAHDVFAQADVPPFDTTGMDGYAVRAVDTAGATDSSPVQLPVQGTIFAGAVADAPLEPGRTWKIMTGAPIPAGADAIVPVEQSRPASADQVALTGAAAPGDHIRAAGSNIGAGALVLAAGTVLGPVQLGVLAGVGVRTVEAIARPRVGVLVTGDELVAEERPLRPGEIYESNQDMLLALLAGAGCEPIDLGIARDDEAHLRRVLADAVQRCDAIVTSGGVSMGDADPVKALLMAQPSTHWMQIAIRPAKPFLLSEFDGPRGPVPLFGLPGNPVSSFVGFELLVAPAVAHMAGRPAPRRPVPAIADAPLANRRGDTRTAYLRASAAFGPDGRLHVRLIEGGQESHQLAASAPANALVQLPDGIAVPIGGEVSILLLTP